MNKVRAFLQQVTFHQDEEKGFISDLRPYNGTVAAYKAVLLGGPCFRMLM
jgi:hypothetical protein